MRRLLIAVIILLVVPLAIVPAGARTGFRVPSGYRVAAWDKVGTGLDRISIRHDGAGQEQSIQVARLKRDAPFALRAVVSNQAIHGGTETTSSMCRRLGCVAGINGDFFTLRSGQPVGGLAVAGQAIRSPNGSRPQLLIGGDNKVAIATESWAGQIMISDGKISLDGVNIPVRGGKVSLFTAAFGKTTGNAKGVAEIAVEILSPKGPLVLGQPSVIRFGAISHMGNSAIPGSGAILAGEGAGAHAIDTLAWKLRNQRIAAQGSIVIRSNAGSAGSIGGSPVLLRDGRRAFTIVPNNLEIGRHPRTVVGWNPQGEVFLVAVDGRQPGYAQGMSLEEAAALLLRLGATDAINLDGGGSTTFVTRGGHVVNRPSDYTVVRKGRRAVTKQVAPGDTILGHHENAVATALVIVPVAVETVRSEQQKISPALQQHSASRFLPPVDDPAIGTISAGSAESGRPRARLAAIALAMILALGSVLYPAANYARRRPFD